MELFLYKEPTSFKLSSFKVFEVRAQTEWNYSYFPVMFNTEIEVLSVMQILEKNGVFPRRYFYPSLNTLCYVDEISMSKSEDIAKRILCLPLYYGLSKKDILKITNHIKEVVC